MIRHLYMLTDKSNGALYIGSTKDLKQRISKYQHPTPNRKSKIFLRIADTGFDNFDFTVLCTGGEEFIRSLETSAIKHFNSLYPHGYNQVSNSLGGGSIGRVVGYRGRKIQYKDSTYDTIDEVCKVSGLSKASIRMKCNRLSGGFKWL